MDELNSNGEVKRDGNYDTQNQDGQMTVNNQQCNIYDNGINQQSTNSSYKLSNQQNINNPYNSYNYYNQQNERNPYNSYNSYNQQNMKNLYNQYNNQNINNQYYNPYNQGNPYYVVNQYDYKSNSTGGEGQAVASMVLGILSIFFFMFFPKLVSAMSITAILLAIISLAQNKPGKGMAISGLIMGILGLLGALFILIISIAVGH
jgi:hypothetical protein